MADDKSKSILKKREDPPPAPSHSSRKVKNRFLDLEPTTETGVVIKEGADDRLDQLIRLGLGDPAKLAFYRRALANPRAAVRDVQIRDAAGDSLSVLIQLILSDPTLFNRLRTLLQTRGRKLTMEDVMQRALELRSSKE